jgi:O-succinylbenzoate synthase
MRRVWLPLVTPFRTAHGEETDRDLLLIRVEGSGGEAGWGECAALGQPTYTSEYVDGAWDVIRGHLAPRLLAAGDVSGEDVGPALAAIKGHQMAKSALEMAVLDAELRIAGRSLAEHLGATRTMVDAGVAVGMAETIEDLLAEVEGYVAEGYRRIKLKVQPGWDVEPLRAVRKVVGDDLALQADANGSYSMADPDHLAALRALDEFGLLCLEQPLADDDLDGHAQLATQLQTPICLDESITSLRSAVEAIERGACRVINIKPGRVGGYVEARRIHDACLARQVPVWCGGMLESGLARAANLALSSLPGFTMPGDLSASARWFKRDLTEPFVLVDGQLPVPTGPGIGVEPVGYLLTASTKAAERIRP